MPSLAISSTAPTHRPPLPVAGAAALLQLAMLFLSVLVLSLASLTGPEADARKRAPLTSHVRPYALIDKTICRACGIIGQGVVISWVLGKVHTTLRARQFLRMLSISTLHDSSDCSAWSLEGATRLISMQRRVLVVVSCFWLLLIFIFVYNSSNGRSVHFTSTLASSV